MNIDSILRKVDPTLIKELTKTLVEMDSQNPPGRTKHIAKFLAEEGKSLGLETKIVPLDNERQNVLLSFGTGPRSLVLSGHLDTVPVGDESKWKYPPLSFTERNGRYYGRGTVDMKGGVATLIAVMAALYDADLPLEYKVLFIGTADEEVGMKGAFQINKEGYMDNAACLVITEATNLHVGIAEKGPLWVRVDVKGKAAHGSMPEKGVNAIYGACKVITGFRDSLPQVENELLRKTTLNVGVIAGGSKINIVPERCSFECDFRLIPEIDISTFKADLYSLVDVLSSNEPFNVSLTFTHVVPALSTNKNDVLVQQMLKWATKLTNNQKSFIGLTYATDAAALLPPKTIPFVIFGAGDPAVLHQANEFVPKKDLEIAAKTILAALVESYSPS
ncbi:hypothetical protein DRO91_07770 [Candidatus Heimdallarchaeota archaeon]|nr:MAG: hypothetical protein DRP02_10870 [Candidatus Gerdarchaeota archaeon]RLI69457.1 MAG: hypothetical protein DRO91_07770 [Candidatus Heimdallarchaeota archaeon]